MIHRPCRTGQKLDVAGLNEIIVIIDRSETELTEVGLNSWAPGLDGPPHAHEQKEQNFLVTAGRGLVRIGADTFPAAAGAFFYVPAGTIHQTINQGTDRLEYFLFNAFLDASKEGHASFADHIAKVKEERRQQAATQRASADQPAAGRRSTRPGKRVLLADCASPRTTLVDRRETARCEAVYHQYPAGHVLAAGADDTKEQTLFILEGAGQFTVAEHTEPASAGEVVFVRRSASLAVTAGPAGLRMVSFGTVVRR
ncbi:MAG: cupin domain-containing protein [Verrucomicrobia bacterium]|nr:cupin domain-containing protein [Verrucomicrobiota bacterium]